MEQRTLDLANFKTGAGEAPFDLDDTDFVSIRELVGRKIDIFAAQLFENDLGPGVFIGYTEGPDGPMHYTTTHAIGIVKIFTDELVRLLEDGNVLPVTVASRASRKTSGRTVLELV